ncbi:MAG: hypothetical protein V4692_13475 [Bdellovibrionota bacterium]
MPRDKVGANATRTHWVESCANGACEINRDRAPLMKYMPESNGEVVAQTQKEN